MAVNNFKYLYGPVNSWRIGRSLGVDPVSATQKTCSFDCIYCQAGKTIILSKEREIFVPTKEIFNEIKNLPEVELDYITFAGNGEPTLAKNLGELIRGIRQIRKEKIAVITNASMIDHKDVQNDLFLANRVEAKLDGVLSETFYKVNQPASSITIKKIIDGLCDFRNKYQGEMILQIMFVQENKNEAEEIAKVALAISPNLIEVNTPLRKCLVSPLSPDELKSIENVFKKVSQNEIPIRNVYDTERKKSQPFSKKATDRRRGRE